jgi:hypothetical protein
MLLTALIIVLPLMVIFHSCEYKQAIAPNPNMVVRVRVPESLKHKLTVDSLTKVITHLENECKLLESGNESIRDARRDLTKIINDDNRLLVDAMLKTLVKTYPKDTVRERWRDIWSMSFEQDYHLDPALKTNEHATTVYVINFEQKTVEKVQRPHPPQGDDICTIFADSIAGYKKTFQITGDFDGDGRQDIFNVDNDMSSKRIPAFPYDEYEFPNTHFKFIRNEGDLDGDGADEIAIYLRDMTIAHYDIWSLKKGAWKYRLTVELSADMRAAGIVPVKKHPVQKGWVRVRRMGDIRSSTNTIYVEEKDIDLRE